MEELNLFPCRSTRRGTQNASIQARLMKLAHEGIVPIGPEGMSAAKAVARNLVAGNQQDRRVVPCRIFKHGARQRSGNMPLITVAATQSLHPRIHAPTHRARAN